MTVGNYEVCDTKLTVMFKITKDSQKCEGLLGVTFELASVFTLTFECSTLCFYWRFSAI